MFEVLARSLPYGEYKQSWEICDAVEAGVRPAVSWLSSLLMPARTSRRTAVLFVISSSLR
jgi:hypothetical protein